MNSKLEGQWEVAVLLELKNLRASRGHSNYGNQGLPGGS